MLPLMFYIEILTYLLSRSMRLPILHATMAYAAVARSILYNFMENGLVWLICTYKHIIESTQEKKNYANSRDQNEIITLFLFTSLRR